MSARKSIVQKLSDGRYQARVWDDNRTPKPGYTSRRFPTRSAALAWVREVEAALSKGVRTENARTRTTVADECGRWLELRKPQVSLNTWRANNTSIRVHITPALGGRAITELRASDVTAFVNTLRAKLAVESTNQVLATLRLVLDMSVEDGRIVANPARIAKPAKAERVARDAVRTAMPLDVIDAIREAMAPEHRIGVTLSLGLGLRAGELRGLTIDRVDFLRGTVRIDRQWARCGMFAEPKHGSHRTIPAPPALLDAINAHVREHGLGNHGLILHSASGAAVHWSQVWIDARKACGGAADGWVPHDLRHAFGSYQLASGQRETRVAGWMGHANLATFLKVYAHDIEDDHGPTDLEAIARPERVHSVHSSTDRAHSVHTGGRARRLHAV